MGMGQRQAVLRYVDGSEPLLIKQTDNRDGEHRPVDLHTILSPDLGEKHNLVSGESDICLMLVLIVEM